MNAQVSYIIKTDITGGTNRATVDVVPDSFDVTVLNGHVAARRSQWLTPPRLVMTFNHCNTVAISFEMARDLLEKLKALDLADEVEEDTE